MKVVLSTIGKFHTFDLARQLERRGALSAIFTGYPRFKLRNEGLPATSIRPFPWLHAPYMAVPMRRWFGAAFTREWEYRDKQSLDAYVAARLPECDVFSGLSGSALRSGKKAQSRGARYVCDRGSAHIAFQDDILREEYQRWGVPFAGIDPRVIAREEEEYAQADLITVPSTFVLESFVAKGVARDKLRLAPYGVDLSRFSPVAEPERGVFDVLFVGSVAVQKGVLDLLDAFARLQHPNKRLTLVGSVTEEMRRLLAEKRLLNERVRLAGHVPQPSLKRIMSASHVMVLPSLQEGLAMVQAQAMACACPVIGTANTGAADLFDDGAEGFIVPIRDPAAIAAKLQRLADEPALRDDMGRAALLRVRRLGGWDSYGERMQAIFAEVSHPGVAGARPL
ncbi:glycosyltransferase [Janthinobacterium sp.]|uniref:glycosyltransferase n=1 Tax=Janthinobacterium sp. TaxID=1871054 RepID=UPI00293D8C9C|nr:glycosyltransferase [Janthinobacterium sp.]